MTLYPDGYAAPQRKPHCGVLSTAICAGVTFETAWDTIGAIRKPSRKPWDGRTFNCDRQEALRRLGVTFTQRVYFPAKHLRGLCREYCDRQGFAERCSLLTFARRHAKPGVTYMIQIARHVVTLRDGIAVDQGSAVPVGEHWCAKRMLQTTLEITGKE